MNDNIEQNGADIQELKNARVAAYAPIVAAIVAGFVSVASLVFAYIQHKQVSAQQERMLEVQIMKTSNEFELGLIKEVSEADVKEREQIVALGDAFYFCDGHPDNDDWWRALRKAIHPNSHDREDKCP